jgi:hypothetical protein
MLNCRNPSTFLIQPLGGSAIHLVFIGRFPLDGWGLSWRKLQRQPGPAVLERKAQKLRVRRSIRATGWREL